MNGGPLLACQDLTHVYLAGTPLASVALRGVSLSIHRGESVAILGPTGSGKSTLVQIFAGLLRPTGGRVWVGGVEIGGRGVDRKRIRQRIGLVFQYPEHQLFEETVFEDVAFGPRNLGLPAEEVAERVEEALTLVGLPPEKFRHRSPFSLSGGEMRRVAIAGVLAMRPEVLILDEPTAGLDPQGRRALWDLVRRLRADRPDLTLVLISHRMDEVAQVCKRVVVLHQGQVVLDAPVREAFREAARLREIGLDVPRVTDVLLRLRAAGLPVRTDRLTVEEACAEIVRALRS